MNVDDEDPLLKKVVAMIMTMKMMHSQSLHLEDLE
jgi:hypothetical protein